MKIKKGKSTETERRPRRTYTKEFKIQIVKVHENGKSRADIIQEYDLSPSSFDTWLKQSRTSSSFNEKENRSSEENEWIQLCKENQHLLMENNLLKQAVLIIGRR